MASVARRYNRQPGERSQARRRAVDNTSLRRLTQAGRRQQTRIRAYLGGGARSPRTTGVGGASGRNVSVVQHPGGRDDSGRQRSRVAPSADRNVSGPRRLRGVTSSEPQRRAPLRQRAATSERRVVSEPQRQARNVGAALRHSGETSAWRKAGLRCNWRRTRPFSRNDGARHTVQNINRFSSVSGVPLFWADPRTFWSSTTTGLLALRVTNSQRPHVRHVNSALRRNSSKNDLLVCCPGTVSQNLAILCLLNRTGNTAIDYPIVNSNGC